MNAKPYFEGRLAFMRGLSERDVPYCEDTDDYHDWLTGFGDKEDEEPPRLWPTETIKELDLHSDTTFGDMVAILEFWGFEYDKSLMGESISHYDTLIYGPNGVLLVSTNFKKMCLFEN